MIMAEAKNRGWLAGWMDAAGWILAISTTTITVSTLQGNNTGEKVVVVVLVTTANLLGTKLGQVIGARFITDATTLAERIRRLEAISLPQNIHDAERKF